MSARGHHASEQPTAGRLLGNHRGLSPRWRVGKIEEHAVILRNEVTKDPMNRTPSVTIRDPSLTLRMTGNFWCVHISSLCSIPSSLDAQKTTVILRSETTKDPVNRTPSVTRRDSTLTRRKTSVTIRDPSLALRMTGNFWCGGPPLNRLRRQLP